MALRPEAQTNATVMAMVVSVVMSVRANVAMMTFLVLWMNLVDVLATMTNIEMDMAVIMLAWIIPFM
ncbi:hypothetical protein V7S43_007594 [Phytophthora oleae]|uniref:Amino acid transporter n=1 Tax=Phytophthora oleae TaxID=2107226 RepID=A0ABD3FKE0_9STRA